MKPIYMVTVLCLLHSGTAAATAMGRELIDLNTIQFDGSEAKLYTQQLTDTSVQVTCTYDTRAEAENAVIYGRTCMEGINVDKIEFLQGSGSMTTTYGTLPGTVFVDEGKWGFTKDLYAGESLVGKVWKGDGEYRTLKVTDAYQGRIEMTNSQKRSLTLARGKQYALGVFRTATLTIDTKKIVDGTTLNTGDWGVEFVSSGQRTLTSGIYVKAADATLTSTPDAQGVVDWRTKFDFGYTGCLTIDGVKVSKSCGPNGAKVGVFIESPDQDLFVKTHDEDEFWGTPMTFDTEGSSFDLIAERQLTTAGEYTGTVKVTVLQP